MKSFELIQERLRSNIEYLRTSQNLTNKALYEKVGISHGSYNSIKRGETKVTLETAISIVDAFNINLHDFVFSDLSQKSDIAKKDINQVMEVLIDYGKRIEDLENR